MSRAPVLLNSKELEQLVRKGSPSLVEFWSPTCSHCAALDPTVERLAREWGERVTIAQVDVGEHPSLSGKWKVLGTPTVLLFNEGPR